jgi:hypothetical protein
VLVVKALVIHTQSSYPPRPLNSLNRPSLPAPRDQTPAQTDETAKLWERVFRLSSVFSATPGCVSPMSVAVLDKSRSKGRRPRPIYDLRPRSVQISTFK